MTFRLRIGMPSAPRIMPGVSSRILYPSTIQFGSPAMMYNNPLGMGGFNNWGGFNQFNGLQALCGPMGYQNGMMQNPYMQLGLNAYQNSLNGGFNNAYGGFNNAYGGYNNLLMSLQGGVPYQNNFCGNMGMNRFPGAFGSFPGIQFAVW